MFVTKNRVRVNVRVRRVLNRKTQGSNPMTVWCVGTARPDAPLGLGLGLEQNLSIDPVRARVRVRGKVRLTACEYTWCSSVESPDYLFP